MKLVCSYCQTDLGQKEPIDDPTVSHGMCAACYAHYRRQWSGLSLGEYLDAFPCPVVVVDEDVRMIAANRPMAELLGKAPEDLLGLKGGEALECTHARRPGGCGSTLHCKTCTIRNSVTRTLETGQACLRVPAALVREGGRASFLISTYKRGPVVQVVIENLEAPEPRSEMPTSDLEGAPAPGDPGPPRKK